MRSAGGAKYQIRRLDVADCNSSAAYLLNGLAVAMRIDLLMRSKGSRHQRWQISFGNARAVSMSMSYLSIGKKPRRVFSAMILMDFSTGIRARSLSTCRKGSTTRPGDSFNGG